MPKRGSPQALTTWEKRYVVRLVTVVGLDLAVEARRELKNALGIDVCVEIVRNVIREASLGLIEKVTKSTLSTKNVKKRLEFSKMHKNWTIYDWERVVLVMRQKPIVYALMGLAYVRFVIIRIFQPILSNRQ
jgi:predicted transcriptional regulator